MNPIKYAVISASDRAESNTSKIATHIVNILKEQGFGAEYFSLEELPKGFFSEPKYGELPNSFAQVLHRVVTPTTHFVFAIPEYNGSFPGVLKHFIDILPPKVWAGKKAALVGVATGRAGNLRGLDHFTAVLHYLKVEVLSIKPLFSSVHLHLDAAGKLTNDEYRGQVAEQLKKLADF